MAFAARAVHPPPGILEKGSDSPQGNKLVEPRRTSVVPRGMQATSGTDGPAVGARRDGDDQLQDSGRVCPANFLEHKRLELLHAIQNSLQLHPGLGSRDWNGLAIYPIHDRCQDALGFSSASVSRGFPGEGEGLKTTPPSIPPRFWFRGASKPPNRAWGFDATYQLFQAMGPLQEECQTHFVWHDACGPQPDRFNQ